jgi:hypothetical protein
VNAYEVASMNTSTGDVSTRIAGTLYSDGTDADVVAADGPMASALLGYLQTMRGGMSAAGLAQMMKMSIVTTRHDVTVPSTAHTPADYIALQKQQREEEGSPAEQRPLRRPARPVLRVPLEGSPAEKDASVDLADGTIRKIDPEEPSSAGPT